MEDREAKSIIEALLFIAGESMTFDSLKTIMEIEKDEVERLTRELVSEYALNNTGLFIVEVAGGVQMVTNPACAPWVKKLISTSVPARLSQPSLETIAIIAYKQPIIKAEIEAIRGVNSDGVVKTLLERRLIKLLGRKEVPGRPLMYGTTKEFLQYFGLKDLSELPTLKEFQEIEIPEPPENFPDETSVPQMPGEEPADAESRSTDQEQIGEQAGGSEDSLQDSGTELPEDDQAADGYVEETLASEHGGKISDSDEGME